MNPAFMRVLDDTQSFLRYTFGTDNNMTLAISGTGHAGMEAGVANIVERGDKVIVGTNGIWGERMVDLMQRFGAEVVRCALCPVTGPIGTAAIQNGRQRMRH